MSYGAIGEAFGAILLLLVGAAFALGALAMWLLPKLWHWLMPIIHAWTA